MREFDRPEDVFAGENPMDDHVSETLPQADSLTKTADYRYAFRGTWDKEPEGRCRVRILEGQGKEQPVMILTELRDNPSTSVTNMIEVLAAELIAKHFPQRFEAVREDPVVLIEHYEPVKDDRGARRAAPTYDRVAFGSWAPRRIWLGGKERVSLSEPYWRHLPEQEVKALLGAEADDF